MKRINSLFIIIFSTLVSVISMVSYHCYVNNLHKPEVAEYTKHSNSRKANNDGVKVIIRDNMQDKKLSSNYKNEEEKVNGSSSNVISSDLDTKKNEEEDSLENYYKYIEKNEKAVFKVSASKIEENLTTSDKIKLLYVSMKLDKEEYKKVKEYLYAKDVEGGVLKALKLLKKDLSEKEYDKVRKVAGRFIDMNLAEELN
ncbi:hypothetical protein [Clostridium estertheticum]|uniref:hypothetical protein n=1 Tax=Clostridium estertheticum TaxID=238834 RepID=UPI001C7CF04C|nr:hypothetical protein [Clostridium estertheticum]MBX4266205.1 hypothetical protein [Clostridium estertheticum]MBX4270408.1 hypothetical protein [Clostridium estertheticum]WLC80944.1 hypothetical protein KTC98_06835 [Clostridium estertheticum]WLC88007.1 hypothetical protein KTC95_18555 [Clostridium estertheticum]